MSKQQEQVAVRIRSIKDYFQEFGVNGIGKGAKTEIIREQIKDAFRREIFDQIMDKLKVDDISKAEETPENKAIVDNILKGAYKKWFGLIKVFNRFRETYNLIRPDELELLKEEHETFDPLDGFDDENEEESDDVEEASETMDGPEDEPSVEESHEGKDGGMAASSDEPGPDADEPAVPAGDAAV